MYHLVDGMTIRNDGAAYVSVTRFDSDSWMIRVATAFASSGVDPRSVARWRARSAAFVTSTSEFERYFGLAMFSVWEYETPSCEPAISSGSRRSSWIFVLIPQFVEFCLEPNLASSWWKFGSTFE